MHTLFRFNTAFKKSTLTGLIMLAMVSIVLSGCSRSQATESSAPPLPYVDTVGAVQLDVAENRVYSGRFEAKDRVDIRPRVSGYITAIDFSPGTTVKKGQSLFRIDSRPYEAALAQATATNSEATALLNQARLELERARRLFEKQAISKEVLEQRQASEQVASAKLQAAIAQVSKAKLDLEYTVIRAPITGIVGRAQITPGNLVSAGQENALTTIEAVSPLYVVFDIEENAFVGKLNEYHNWQVAFGLAGTSDFPINGSIAFINNRVSTQTGTLQVRALLPNKENEFLPGQFIRVQLTTGDIPQAVVIDEKTIRTEQGQRYVLIVGNNNVLEYRRVTLGPTVNGQRVVRSGINANERVVISGQMGIRAGIAVQPVLLEPNVLKAAQVAIN